MLRYVSWLANAVLFALCCFLVANAANAVFSAVLVGQAGEVVATPATRPASGKSWKEREIILSRNLFNASLLAPQRAVEPEPEVLEATKLPLVLLGTAACAPPATEPGCSHAVVQDKTTRQSVVVRVNDPIQTAKVTRIERRRIVLLENDKLRELALDENAPGRPAVAKRRPKRQARANRRRGAPKRPVAPKPPAVPKAEVQDMVRNPASLFSQARILPKYEAGEMVGLQVNAIKPGSLFEDIGLANGDVITELNGIAIETPEESAKILEEFAEASDFVVVVETDGEVRELEFTVPENERGQ